MTAAFCVACDAVINIAKGATLCCPVCRAGGEALVFDFEKYGPAGPKPVDIVVTDAEVEAEYRALVGDGDAEAARLEGRGVGALLNVAIMVFGAIALGLFAVGMLSLIDGPASDAEVEAVEPLVVWERVGGGMRRAPVPGGWLVDSAVASAPLVYVPDADHGWGR